MGDPTWPSLPKVTSWAQTEAPVANSIPKLDQI